MPRVVPPELPRDEPAEAQLRERIRLLGISLQETLQQLADARAELEIRKRLANGTVPQWLRPAKRGSLAEITMNALRHDLYTGLKFAQIEREIERTGREVHKPSLTATLGRLRRSGKIVRRKGRWKIVTYADREPEEPAEREYDKEAHMD
jgi:hypothetical protein